MVTKTVLQYTDVYYELIEKVFWGIIVQVQSVKEEMPDEWEVRN